MNKVGNILLIFIILVPQAFAYYCDHDSCGTEQYCCGDNLCCDYVYSLWYFWVGVAFLVLIVSACGAFYRYFYDTKQYVVIPYFQPWNEEKSQNQYLTKQCDDNQMPDDGNYRPLPTSNRKPESHIGRNSPY